MPSIVSGSAGVQRLSWRGGVGVGEPMFRSWPPEAVAPLEWPGDGVWRGGRRSSDPQPAGRQSVLGLRSSLAQNPALEDRWALERDGHRYEKMWTTAPPNICPIITGMISRLTNHSSITGVTDCVHQTGGLLIGSSYDLASGESALNCESRSQPCVTLSSLRVKTKIKTKLKLLCVSLLTSHPSNRSLLSSILFASVSLSGLSDLAKCSQNPQLCSMDYWEWRPPLGHWRSRPHRLGADPQFWEAEVDTIVVNSADLKSLIPFLNIH